MTEFLLTILATYAVLIPVLVIVYRSGIVPRLFPRADNNTISTIIVVSAHLLAAVLLLGFGALIGVVP